MPVSFSIADSSEGPRKVVIWVTGDLDAEAARAVSARLAQAERHASSDVILDLTGVTSVEAVGLSSIVSSAKAIGAVGQLRVISPPERIAQLFDEAGMSEVFALTPNRRAGHADRRRRQIWVESDRRKGDRRHDPEAA